MGRTGYQLEALEARVLLSGDSTVCAACLAPDAERAIFPIADAGAADLAADFHSGARVSDAASLLLDPAGNFDDVSSTLEQLTSASIDPDAGAQPHVTSALEPNDDSSPVGTVESAAQEGAVETAVADVSRGFAVGDAVLASTASFTVTGATVYSPQAEQLTQTLRSANGPPASSVDSELVPTSSTVTSFESDCPSCSSAPAQSTHLTPDQTLIAVAGLVVGSSDKLSGNGTIIGNVINSGVLSPGNSPGILTFNGDLVLNPSSTVLIEIGGLTPGPGTATDLSLEPGPGSSLNGYDQINVTGKATLGGTLQIQLINNFHPTLGDTFTIISGESLEGDFSGLTAYHIGDGLYLKPVKEGNVYRLDVVNWTGLFGLGPVPTNLNGVIDFLLSTFDPTSPPNGTAAEFTSSAGEIPSLITIGTTLGGGVDLRLENVTLVFSELAYASGSWTGKVAVRAESGVLLAGLLDIAIGDDGSDASEGDDTNSFAVEGGIELGSTASTLFLDDLDAKDLGWPTFLKIGIQKMEMSFPDFRMNDNDSSLSLTPFFKGWQFGIPILDSIAGQENPFFGLTVSFSVSVNLNLGRLEAGVRDPSTLLVTFPRSPIEFTGFSASITGRVFKVGSLNASLSLREISLDPDGTTGPKSERSVVYLAIRGALSLTDDIVGPDDGFGFDVAFAVSELGPLEVFGSLDTGVLLEPTTGLNVSQMRLAVKFNTTIEGLQTDKDFALTAAEVSGTSAILTIPGHDLKGPSSTSTRPGDDFKIRGAGNWDGKYTVLSVISDDQITVSLPTTPDGTTINPGPLLTEGEVVRLTIRDPLDLRDTGLSAGTAPADFDDWLSQIDERVKDQITNVASGKRATSAELVLAGGATLDFANPVNPRIPSELLSFEVDLFIDTELRILLAGDMVLGQTLKYGANLFADLSDLFNGNGTFLFLKEMPESFIGFEPLLVYRGAVAFEALTSTPGGSVDGFKISLSGGVDLNVPGINSSGTQIKVAILTMEGGVDMSFRFPAGDVDLELMLNVTNVKLSLTLFDEPLPDIATFNASFTIEVDPDAATDKFVLFGAARLTTNFEFLQDFGLFANNVGGLLLLNSSGVVQTVTLAGTPITIKPSSYLLRMDARVDFRINFDGEDGFEANESVFLIDGSFVLEFSAEQGFNVAVFSEETGIVGPATLKLGPANSPSLEFKVFGFLAIRSDGFAANMVLSFDASLPGVFADVASINGQFVFIVNTTGDTITFDIPSGADERGGASDLSVTIPRAPPASIAESSVDVFKLIRGEAWSDHSTLGSPYVFVLLGGTDAASNPEATFVLGGFSLSGKFGFLASFNPVTSDVFVEMQFNAHMRLQPLNGQLLASGSLKINDQGVVGGLLLGGQLNLGPLTIVGAFTLEVNTTDDEQLVPRYEFDFVNEVFKQDAQGNPVVQNISVGADTVALFAFAKFRLTNSFVLQGSVAFVDNPDLLALDLHMSIQFFSTELNVVGAARIVKTGGSEGLVLKLSASLSANAFGVTGIFSFTAGMELRINARPGDQNTPLDANDLGLERQTFRIEVTNATLSLLSVVTLTGSGYVEITQGVFRMQADLSGNFLSIFSVSASAFFSSEGEFRIVLDGGVQLGPNGFNLHASAHLEVSRLDLNGIEPRGTGDKTLYVAGRLSGGAEIFWIPINFPSIGVSYNGGSGEITVTVGPVLVPAIGRYRVRTWFGSFYIYYPTLANKYFTFSIGTLKETPAQDPPPPPITLGQVDVAGVLTLNVGSSTRRAARNLLGGEENEEVSIERLAAGSSRGEKIQITMFGVSQVFDNVTSILIADMDSGNDLVEIAANVAVQTEVHFGEGTDTLRNNGGGVVVAYGDGGEDHLEGGQVNDRLYGGAGDDFIDGKSGSDWIEGGDNEDVLIGGAGADTIAGGEGDDLIAGDLAPFPPVVVPPDIAAEAQDIDLGGWNLNFDGQITDSTGSAHISIRGTGDETFDYYSFTVTAAGERGIFDIDSENFDTQLFLYDSSGKLLASNDENGSDPGSGSSAASLIDFVFPAAGTYVIGVAESGSFHVGEVGVPGQIGGNPPDAGDSYTLHASLQHHALNLTGTDPVSEMEPNQPLPPVNPTSFVFETMATETGGVDTIAGGDGDDVVFGGSRGDYISGDAGEDILVGDDGRVTISETGTETEIVVVTLNSEFGGNDTIEGGGGGDIIFGGREHDYLEGGSGSDILAGDDGWVTVSGSAGINTIIQDSGFSGNDQLDGGGENDTLYGQKGADILLGGLGTDTLEGLGISNRWILNGNNSGNLNTVATFSSIETIVGGTATDTLVGPALTNAWTLTANNAGSLNGMLTFSSIETITGGTGTDTLVGPAMANTWTLSGNNAGILNGALSFSSIETITGGAGADTLIGPALTNTWTLSGINAGDLNSALTFSSIETLTGGTGADTLVGPTMTNTWTLSGNNAGNLNHALTFSSIEMITGGTGPDTLVGPALTNTWTLSGNNAGDLNSVLSFSSIETLTGGSGADTLIGPATGNTWSLTGNHAGNLNQALTFSSIEHLVGGSGADNFMFQPGADFAGTLDGGGGVDWMDYSAYTTSVNVDLESGVATGTAGILNILNVRGGGVNDRILGNAGNNVFEGLVGDDLLVGRGGADTISGGLGDDLIVGDQGTLAQTGSLLAAGAEDGGADILAGDEGNDIILGDAATVTWDANGVMTSVASTNASAGGNDQIWGGEGQDVIMGGEGDDALDGGSGADLVFGDNAQVARSGLAARGALNPRFRMLAGSVIYDASGNPLVADGWQLDPDGVPAWGDFTICMMNNAAVNSSVNDYLAGGAGNDMIFGQMGADTIQGDGSIDLTSTGIYAAIGTRVGAVRDGANGLLLNPSVEAATDGADYIEGGGGSDVIFGNLGQDDLIGGSSSLFGLSLAERLADGSDLIFGGAGTDLARNHLGDQIAEGHARDADVIVGDNGNIFRLVALNGQGLAAYLAFNYDNYGSLKIVPRAVAQLDYVIGIPGDNQNVIITNVGAADEIHGESGDDFIYGMVGNDLLFGEGQDDDLVGGQGKDWISGGAGDDGVLGDDGRIFTSRNGMTEPLYGIQPVAPLTISTPGKVQLATINIAGTLTKSVDLVLQAVAPNQLPAGRSDDIIYGGLGKDFIHGGDGDDALSGAEALTEFYTQPANSGNALNFGGYGDIKGYEDATEFAAYDQYHPLKRVSGFLLNFEASAGDVAVDDGSDALFGDGGNDWLVGGTNRDFLFGGWGNDLLDADDNQATAAGLNNVPDAAPFDAGDLAFGGAGRDVLLANSASDRLIDWVGEFNSYVVPLSSFGMPTVSRTHQPQLADFLYALSRSLGADQTRVGTEGGEAVRNGEPFGELGLVIQQDQGFWQEQTGPTNDPQSGNTPSSQRDTRFLETFDSGLAGTFAAVTENWKVSTGRYLAAPARGAEAVSLLLLNDALPSYAELLATVNTNKGKSGVKADAYLIFDYQDQNNFKFAGIDVGLDKLRIGVRTTAGWTYLTQSNMFLSASVDYSLRLVLDGGKVTLQVTGPGMTRTLSHDFSAPVNGGWLGLATENSVARFDNVAVQVLPPSVTQRVTDDFTDVSTNPFAAVSGDWAAGDGRYAAAPGAAGDSAVSILSQDLLDSYGLELQVKLNTQGFGGIVFDYENALNFKFVGMLAGTNQVVIGHRTAAGWFFDKVVKQTVTKGVDYQLGVSVHDATVRVTFNGVTVASQTYRGFLNDGRVGLFTLKSASQFDDVSMRATSR